jgi:Glycosyltransferase family 87
MASTQVSFIASSWNKWIAARLPVGEAAFLLALSALLLGKGLVPGWQALNTDFPNYYVVARLIREHYCLDRIFDWIWFQRVAIHFGVGHQLVGFLGLTPFSALPIIPLSWLPILAAKRFWIVCNVALLAISVQILGRKTGLGSRRAWLVALCAILPLRSSFLFGQMHILVLALLVAAYVCHLRGRQISSGCCIAVAGALKIYPFFFLLYFLFKKRWRAAAAVLVCITFCLLVSYLISGRTAMNAYLFQQLPRSLQGESGNPFLPSLTSSSALFHRLFLYEPELNPHPLVFSPRAFAIFYPLWQALLVGIVILRLRTGYRADERESLEWSMFLCLLMFLSSAPASYQFVVLIAAAIPTASILIKRHAWKAAFLYMTLYFLACNVRAIHLDSAVISLVTPLFYLTLWSGVALLLFYSVLLRPLHAARTESAKHFFHSAAFRAGLAVAGIWILGGLSAWSHLKNTPVNHDLVDLRDGAYLRTAPVNTSEGPLFVAMFRDGFRIQREGSPRTDPFPGFRSGSDELSFVASLSGRDVWIEKVSDDGSLLVHIARGTQTQGCEIGDAEEPALADDETVLGFLREDHGHGSLWTIDLHQCALGVIHSPVRITSSSLDVRSLAAGPDGVFLISAIYQGRECIFTVRAGASAELLAENDAALDSPALSPDGGLLVMRELISHRWQLVSLDLSSHVWKQLTYGDCNAYTPSWKEAGTIFYSTDCMRGIGLTTLASLKVTR